MAIEQIDLTDHQKNKEDKIKDMIKNNILKKKKKKDITQDDINELVFKIAEILNIEIPQD